MARTVERIEEDIALEEALSALAAEISAYSSYLTTLGPAVRKSLILASYHICTQGYAKPFLSLSLNQRHCSTLSVSWGNKHLLSYSLIPGLRRERELRGLGAVGEESNSFTAHFLTH